MAAKHVRGRHLGNQGMFLGSQATEDQNRKLKERVKFRCQAARHPRSANSGDPKSFRAWGLLTAMPRWICTEWQCSHRLVLGYLPKVSGLVLCYRGNGDLKCCAKNDVCRMLNPCDAITVGNHSALSFIATSGCASVRLIASARISAASTI